MPKGDYILCCQGSSNDKDSGLFSAFEFIEMITVSPIPAPKDGEQFVIVQLSPLRIVACWMIEPHMGEKFEDEFEFEFRILHPDGEISRLTEGKFKFAAPHPVPFHRLTLSTEVGPPFEKSGIVRVEGRARKKGTDQWVSQDYPIVVHEHTSPENLGKPANPSA